MPSTKRQIAQKVLANAVRRWPTDAARRWVAKAVDRAVDSPNVVAIVAVGSAIRPVATSEDVDLFVIYNEHRPSFGRHPIEVDIRYYEAETIDALIRRRHDYVLWTLQFGIPVFERDHFWSGLQAAWRNRLPLPSADEAEAREARALNLLDELVQIGDDDAVLEQRIAMLTHRARAKLLRRSVFPASRPELPMQLREIGELALATQLADALKERDRGRVSA